MANVDNISNVLNFIILFIKSALFIVCVLLVEKIEMADVTADQVITAVKGDSEVLLPCVTTPGAGTKVMWAKSTETGSDRIFTYRFYNERISYGTNYKDQTDIYDIADVDENGTKKQLRIRNPGASQSGLYVCLILGAPDTLTYSVELQVLFSATKLTFDAPTTMTDGHQYDIRCTSDAGNPDPEIIFKTNGVNGTVTTNTIPGWYNATKAVRTLSITATRAMNGKKVECYLQTNNNIKVETTLNVLYAPTQVRITATSASVRENTDMTFQCATNGGNPLPQFRIEKRLANGSMTHASQYTSAAQAAIRVQFTRDDNGFEFFCRASSSDNSVLAYYNLSTTSVTADVRFDASSVIIEDNIHSSKGGLLLEGVENEITCKSNEGNPAPVINYNTNGIEGTSVMTQSNVQGYYNAFKANRVLKLTQVTREMNGKSIECYLENPNNVNTMYNLNVKFAPNGVGIQVVPVLKVGEKYNVTCLSNTANPVTEVGMKITWNRNARQDQNENHIIDGSFNGQRHRFIYTLTAKKEDHGHDMTCTVQWESGPTAFQGTKKLNINYPPVLTIGGDYDDNILEGQELALTCETSEAGNPTTYTYQWKYKTQLIDNQAGSEYRMQQIAYTDAGTYQCVASNYEGGTATADKTVVVLYAAKSLKNNIQVFYAEQAEQITLSFNFTVLPYDDVKVEWIFNNYKENVTVYENSVTTTQIKDKIHQTKYTITSVKDNHFGTYFIKIRNNQWYPELKEAEFNITFELKGKPVAPDIIFVNSTSPTSLNVTWKVQRDGGFAQTFIVEYWREGEDDRTRSPPLKAKKLDEVQAYKISGLVPNKLYQVQVITQTKYGGGSLAKSSHLVVKTKADENGAVNMSMIFGITVGVLLLIIVSVVGFVIFLKYKYNFTTKKPGRKESTENDVHTYANQELLHMNRTQNDADLYEPVQGITPQAPSVYSRLEISKKPMVKAAQSEKESLTYEDTEVAANAATEPEYEDTVVAATGVHTEYENTVVAVNGDTEYEEPVVATIAATEPEYEDTVVPNYEEPVAKDQTYANAQGRQESSIYLTLD